MKPLRQVIFEEKRKIAGPKGSAIFASQGNVDKKEADFGESAPFDQYNEGKVCLPWTESLVFKLKNGLRTNAKKGKDICLGLKCDKSRKKQANSPMQ